MSAPSEKAVQQDPPAYTPPSNGPSAAAPAVAAESAPAVQPEQHTSSTANATGEVISEPTRPAEAYAPKQTFTNAAAPAHRPQFVTPLRSLGDQPADVDCPYCKCVTRTRVEQTDSSTTILAGVFLGILCICLACLPCIMHAFNDIDHYCSRCNKHLTHRAHDGATVVIGEALVPSQYQNSSNTAAAAASSNNAPAPPQFVSSAALMQKDAAGSAPSRLT